MLFIDRDRARSEGQQRAVAALKALSLKAYKFDWEQGFQMPGRVIIHIPTRVTDAPIFYLGV